MKQEEPNGKIIVHTGFGLKIEAEFDPDITYPKLVEKFKQISIAMGFSDEIIENFIPENENWEYTQ